MTGWALDHVRQSALQVDLYVSSRFARAVDADTARRDVAQVQPAYGPDWGYGVTRGLPKESQRVCAHAITVGAGTTDTLLGRRTVC